MESAIEVSNLIKRFGNIIAVNELSFKVQKGEIFGFLGPNGAGKTTTIRILSGLTKPTSGIASIASFDIVHQVVKAKAHIGVVPEVSNIYDEMSAWDNLIFSAQLYGVPRSERAKRAKQILEQFGLYERREGKVGTFSKGMKRRITIAMALIHEPAILFLDEPTTGLDVQSARIIREHINKLNKEGTTIFLTTHYIEEADQLCERIAIINQGKIVALDTPEKLKATAERQNVIEVSFNSTVNLGTKLKNLSQIQSISQIGDKFRLHVDDTSETVSVLADFARENDLKIMSINTLKPSLEDAFVQFTGLNPEVMTTEKEKGKSAGLG